VQFTNGLLVI